MSIGLCCQYIEPITKKSGKTEYNNLTNEKTLQHGQFVNGKYSTETIESTWVNNLNGLFSVLKKINSENIKVFRFSSNLLPLFDFNPNIRESSKVLNLLSEIGLFAKKNNIRLTTHPDQFCVLSSNKDGVIANSISILEYHAWVMDKMNLDLSPFYAINVHGGTKGNSNILKQSIDKLPDNVRSRLTLENDERSYNVKDLYDVSTSTGVPIVFDSHHHTFNDSGLSIEAALELSAKTWNTKPLTHLSNTDPSLVNGNFTERRKHSFNVHYIPDCQLKANNNNQIDIEFEFKGKNLAIFKAVKDFDIKL